MRKHIFKLIACIIGVFVICQGVNITQIKTMVLQPKYSIEKQNSYAYMGYDGNMYTTTAGGAQTDMVYELLLAITNKYGEEVASTYYSCMQTGNYSAYYSTIGSKTPSYNEGFVYSTNGNKQDMTTSQISEQYLQISGLSSISELVQASNAAGYGTDAKGIKKYIHAIANGEISKPTSTITTQAAVTQPETVSTEAESTEETQEKTATEVVEKKEISHGLYDGLSDEAEEAFAELLSDGVDESCYIQIKADAEDRTISAETVSKTLSQKEDGRVEFYNKEENEDYSDFSYSVTFPQIEVESDVDLAATYALLDTSKYENVYQFAFVTEQNLSSEVEITLNVNGSEGDKYYLLRGNDDSDYNNFATAECDENGYITFKTNQLDNIIVTTTDIVSMRQAEEEAALKIEEEAKQAEETSVEASTQTSAEAEVEIETSEETQNDNEQEKSNMPFILIGIGCLAVLGAGTGALVYKKRH